MKSKCRLCAYESSNTLKVEEMMYGSNASYDYLVCDKCGSLSLVDIPKNIASYYPKDYYSFVNSKNSGFRSWISNKKSSTNLGNLSIVGSLVSFITGVNSNLKAIKICQAEKTTSRILDIGSGGGLLLDKLNEQGYKYLMGIDPYLDKDIEEKDYKIKKMTIEDLVEEQLIFDIIILSHVFEHLEDPNNSLSNIYKLLAKDGKLILRVPISSSLAFRKFKKYWFQIDAPRHILIPSFSGLLKMCGCKGFELQEYFFDSNADQFLVSENYKRGLSMSAQKSNGLALKYNPKRVYYQLLAKYANYKDCGDQATFVFRKQ